jgi:hypothetical protein
LLYPAFQGWGDEGMVEDTVKHPADSGKTGIKTSQEIITEQFKGYGKIPVAHFRGKPQDTCSVFLTQRINVGSRHE